MIPASPVVRLASDLQIPPRPSFADLPCESFESLWERDARWLLGPRLLSDVVLFLQGKHLVLGVTETTGMADVTLPLPHVRDAVSSRLWPVGLAVPPELRPVFEERCSCVLALLRDESLALLEPFLYRAYPKGAPGMIVAEMNAVLREAERRAARAGHPELWQIAAACFGLPWVALPEPAGVAF